MNGDDRQPGIDTFTVSQLLRGPANSVLLSTSQFYNTKFEWKTVSGVKIAANPYNIADTSYIQFGITGGDNGFWGGYFGPQIRNVSMSLNYSIDPCVSNPAYSPSCPNYNTVTTSANLLPGTTGQQVYAINQALSHSGSGLMIHGFSYGYTYNIGGMQCTAFNQDGSCSWQMASTGSVSTKITDSNNTTIYNKVDSYTGPTNGVKDVTYLFPQSLNTATLGTFRMTPGINGSGSITNMYSSAIYTQDPCTVDPLSSTSCPGYAQAIFTQQCTANPLYDSACPGYAQAIFTQQCTANPLYNTGCPGYAQAYLTYQCSVNPLYSTTCAGYAEAYFNQQCTADPLYNTGCPGYAQAYFNQQCTADPLYNTGCPGYAEAYLDQQCTANSLYDSACPGYAQAYFNQQCSLNGLYSQQCTNYSEAYAKKMILETQGIASVVSTAGNITSIAAADPEKQATAISSDSNVNSVVAAKSTATTSETSPAAAVKLTAPVAPTQQLAQADSKKENSKKNDSSSTTNTPAPSSKPADKPKTTKEAIAEKRREAVQKEAINKGKELAKEMGKAADMQAQMEVQNVVIQAMGFTPGFDNYNRFILPDNQFYKPYTIYNNQRNVDTPAGRGLFGGSDKTHANMVDSQYNLGN
jgi:hypothetical protein